MTVRLSALRLIETLKRLPPAKRAKLLLLMVLGFSDSEKVRTTTAFGPTSVAPSVGVTISTCGAVTSAIAPVSKVLKKKLLLLPTRSATLKTCTKMRVLAGSGAAGVKVTIAPLTVKLPATCAPVCCTPMFRLLLLMEVGSMTSLKVSTTLVLTGTPVAPLLGVTAVTNGLVVSGVATAAVVKLLLKGTA